MADPGTVVPPGGTLGVLGGGQLGRMFCHAAQRHGYHVRCWGQSPDEPAVRAADAATVAPFEDEQALREFAAGVDAVTVEFNARESGDGAARRDEDALRF